MICISSEAYLCALAITYALPQDSHLATLTRTLLCRRALLKHASLPLDGSLTRGFVPLYIKGAHSMVSKLSNLPRHRPPTSTPNPRNSDLSSPLLRQPLRHLPLLTQLSRSANFRTRASEWDGSSRRRKELYEARTGESDHLDNRA